MKKEFAFGFYPVSGSALYLETSTVVSDAEKYDNIIIRITETLPDLAEIAKMLSQNGRLIISVSNRFGCKYLCGETDSDNDMPFNGICDDNDSRLIRMSETELLEYAEKSGLKNLIEYYLFADNGTTCTVYSDRYIPGNELIERNITRGNVYSSYSVMDRSQLIKNAARNGFAHKIADMLAVVCTNGCDPEPIYACVTDERCNEHAFVTCIYSDDTVRKIPVFEQGQNGLEKLVSNHMELEHHSVPALPVRIINNEAVMEKIESPTLSEVIRKCKTREEILHLTDKLYDYIINSSEHIDHKDNKYIGMSPDADWGVILKKAYYEMIPVNCFADGDNFMFFDQEYSLDNCPACFIMHRAIRDIYNFIPKVSEMISIDEMKERYNTNELWDIYEIIEQNYFEQYLRKNSSIVPNFTPKINQMYENRQALKMNREKNNVLFNIFLDYNNEKLILFGSGKFADYYLDKYENVAKPDFIIDNDETKYGKFKRGIEIRNPNELHKMIYGSFRIIIAIKNYQPIIEQLESMGIGYQYYRVFNKYYDSLMGYAISDPMIECKYNIGYLPGAFDLFHIGHLNILRRSKERCHYLIAGVLTDDIIRKEKGKEPFIPFEERFEIVKQCKYVDRAVPVDFQNTDKLEAFKQLRFSCMFAGSDHGNGYDGLKKDLQVLGSNIEIFPYTETTSSTMLQQLIRNNIEAGK